MPKLLVSHMTTKTEVMRWSIPWRKCVADSGDCSGYHKCRHL